MIVTLTPNPSIDRTISVDVLEHGEVHRATESRIARLEGMADGPTGMGYGR